jgi:hypothetical protein
MHYNVKLWFSIFNSHTWTGDKYQYHKNALHGVEYHIEMSEYIEQSEKEIQ